MVDRSEVSNRPVTTQFGTALLTVSSSTKLYVRDDPAGEFVVNRIRITFHGTLTFQDDAEEQAWKSETYVRRWTGGDVSWNASGKLRKELRQAVAAWTDEHPELLRLADRLNVRDAIESMRSEIAEAEQALERQRAELAALVSRALDDGIVA